MDLVMETEEWEKHRQNKSDKNLQQSAKLLTEQLPWEVRMDVIHKLAGQKDNYQ